MTFVFTRYNIPSREPKMDRNNT